jgi:hypothetical protein
VKKFITTACLAGALTMVPIGAFASTQTPEQKPAATKHTSSTSTAATHSTRGTVKSVDDNTLVIARSSGTRAEMTFTLNDATHREGNIANGASVSVRYRDEGKMHVATAVHAEPAKKQAPKK